MDFFFRRVFRERVEAGESVMWLWNVIDVQALNKLAI